MSAALAGVALGVTACSGGSSTTSGTFVGTVRVCKGPIGEPPPDQTAAIVLTRAGTPGTQPLTIRVHIIDGVGHASRELAAGSYQARLLEGGTSVAAHPVTITAGSSTPLTLGPPAVCPLQRS